MNERIKELLTPKLKEWGGDSDDNFSEELEKFAELIVRECADAIIKDSRLSDVRSAANGCVRTIKEHFGVEE